MASLPKTRRISERGHEQSGQPVALVLHRRRQVDHAAHPDNEVGQATEQLLGWGNGMTAYLPKQVKLFADGAIYSQAMQLGTPATRTATTASG